MLTAKKFTLRAFLLFIVFALPVLFTIESERRVIAYPAKERAQLKASENTPEEFENLVRLHWSADQWDDLEALAQRLRGEQPSFPHGESKLSFFYDIFSKVSGRYPAFPANRFTPWLDKHPESETARIAFAAAYIGFGWARRGRDYASTVTATGWKQMDIHAKAAIQLLREAERKGTKDPELYSRLISAVASIDSGGEKQRELDDIFNTGISLTPNYLPLYKARLHFASAAWGGTDELQRIVLKRAETTPRDGGRVYADLASELFTCSTAEQRYGLNWDVARKGIEALIESSAPEVIQNTQYLSAACLKQDNALAKRIFQLRDTHKPEGALRPMSEASIAACSRWSNGTAGPIDITPLHRAVSDGSQSTVAELISSGADVNAIAPDGSTPLLLAVERCNRQLTETLLSFGAKPDQGFRNGWGTLHLAVSGCPTPIVELLLAHGASVNILSEEGHTPLYSAASSVKPDVVRILLARPDIVPNERKLGANTPLLGALEVITNEGTSHEIIANRQEVINALLNDPRVDVKASGIQGWTALHAAVSNNDEELVRRLLELGLSITEPNAAGFTPLKLAHHWKRTSLVKIMKESRTGAYHQFANFISRKFEIY